MAGAQHNGARKGTPPFPVRQMTILALCRICEPIAFMSIFPYVYFMIQDFKVAHTDSQVAVYAGMVTSAFAFAEFSSGVIWGKLSDKIGRKPVLLTGLAGTALSMILFGFAPSLPIALLARALGGLLNGNIGVLQTTLAEMVTEKEHQPRAYTIMPFVWCLGSILGPTLGGALAKPVKSFPSIFVEGSIWDKFPYLLPNLVCTLIVICGVIIGLLFLEETHAEKKYRRDPGLEAGKWILSLFTRRTESSSARCEKGANIDEAFSLLTQDDEPPGYRTTDGSPKIPSTPSPEPQEALDLNDTFVPRSKPAVTKAFTRQVILNIVSYGLLAYHTMTFDAMLPTLLASPIADGTKGWSLPFKFVGGFNLLPKEIGVILSVQGLYSIFSTVILFPIVVRRLGTLGLCRAVAISYPLLYLVTPYLVLLPDNLRMIGIYIIVIWKCTFSTMAYPANAILLTNSAPSLLMLGTINGVAASTASLSRAFGPTVSGFLFSTGMEIGYCGLSWWCSAAISVAGGLLSLRMSDTGGRMSVDEKSEDSDIDIEEHIEALDSALSAAEPRISTEHIESIPSKR